MREDCIKFIRECEQCTLFNEETSQESNYPILVGDAYVKIGIDLIGQLTETKEENKYIFVAIDYLTKCTIIQAIKYKTAHEIAKFFLTNVFSLMNV